MCLKDWGILLAESTESWLWWQAHRGVSGQHVVYVGEEEVKKEEGRGQQMEHSLTGTSVEVRVEVSHPNAIRTSSTDRRAPSHRTGGNVGANEHHNTRSYFKKCSISGLQGAFWS